ncbi:hypothetical protein KIPB_012299, partial [Kipferlia bialata]|eukprot:g12299.t1
MSESSLLSSDDEEVYAHGRDDAAPLVDLELSYSDSSSSLSLLASEEDEAEAASPAPAQAPMAASLPTKLPQRPAPIVSAPREYDPVSDMGGATPYLAEDSPAPAQMQLPKGQFREMFVPLSARGGPSDAGEWGGQGGVTPSPDIVPACILANGPLAQGEEE